MFRFCAGLTIAILLLFVGHWFPWPRQLHRLCAYVYGCACILVGAGVWLLGTDTDVWLGLAGLVVGAGLATVGAYGVDWWLNARLRIRQVDHERHD